MEVPTHQAAEHGAAVEDAPEPGKVAALLLLIGVRDHDGALRRPQQTGADTQEDAGEEVEAADAGVDGDEQADGVDAVADAAKGKRPLDTELVDEGAAKEAKDGKGAVQGRVLVVVSRR